jgi:predicted ATP-grasp superfamily ATP-dependent carboligase/glycosyltransferase involved in cell wall biosynthesis
VDATSPIARVLILVENASVPEDGRVTKEALSLIKNGYSVSVICPAGEGESLREVLDGIDIRRYRSIEASGGALSQAAEYFNALMRTFWLMVRMLRSPGFDVIQACNPPDLLCLIVWPFTLLGKRFIFDQHDLTPELYEVLYGRRNSLAMWALKWSERVSYRMADAVIVCNDSYRHVALSRGRIPAERVFTVRNGPSEGWPKPAAPDPSLKAGRRYLVAYVGVMGYQDGVDVLLRCIDVLVNDMGVRDTTFALIGDGHAAESLRQQARELGIEAFVEFTGWIRDPASLTTYLRTADACVSPEPSSPLNDHSTFIKVMEYMAFGIPIVAFDLAETRVSAGDAAAYATPGDVNGFALLLREILTDGDLRNRMIEAAAARIPSLRWERQVPNLLAAYRFALGSPEPPKDAASPPARHDDPGASAALPGQRQRAVVLGAHYGGLSVARALGAEGVEVMIVASDTRGHAALSRFVSRYLVAPDPSIHAAELLRVLMTLEPEWAGALLMPTLDEYVIFVSQNHGELERRFRFAVPTWDVVDAIINKNKLYSAAVEAGVPVPDFLVPLSAEDLELWRDASRYPCIIKPYESRRFSEIYGAKVLVARDFAELTEKYLDTQRRGLDVMVCEIIPGDDSTIISYHAYIDSKGDLLSGMCSQKLRQYPTGFGQGAVVRSVPLIAEARDQTITLLRHLGYRGEASTEFRFDRRDGRYKLMEINARPIVYESLFVAAGINFPCITADDVLRDTRVESAGYDSGVTWIHNHWEAVNLVRFLRAGHRSVAAFFAPYRGRRVYVVPFFEDPLHSLWEVWLYARHGIRRLGGH